MPGDSPSRRLKSSKRRFARTAWLGSFGLPALADANNWYGVRYEFAANDFLLSKEVGGTRTDLDSDTSATDGVYTAGEVLTVRLTWDDGTLGGSEDDLTAELLTEDGTLHTRTNEQPSVNGSFVRLRGGNLSVTAWRNVLESRDSGVQLDVTIRERPRSSNAGNVTPGPPPVGGE